MNKELCCSNCCIDDFKYNLCDCDNGFCKEFKSIGNQEDFFENVMNRINEPKWIPCSERLPNTDGEYLVWYEKDFREELCLDEIGKENYEDVCESFGYWKSKFDPVTFGFIGEDWVEVKVSAWMPLPEPYKGTQELVADEKEKEYLNRTFPHDGDGEWYDLTDMINKGE